MTDQRDPASGDDRMGRATRSEGWGIWGMFGIMVGAIALLFVSYMIYGTSPDAPNTTRSSEYQSRPIAPPVTQPSTPAPN